MIAGAEDRCGEADKVGERGEVQVEVIDDEDVAPRPWSVRLTCIALAQAIATSRAANGPITRTVLSS